MLKAWPQRSGVPDSVWQTQAPKLLGFWAQNLPAHPEWKISPDRELVGTVSQILLKQIGYPADNPDLAGHNHNSFTGVDGFA
jgi:type VI secretion system protein ImpL